jgi:hypothetical protein
MPFEHPHGALESSGKNSTVRTSGSSWGLVDARATGTRNRGAQQEKVANHHRAGPTVATVSREIDGQTEIREYTPRSAWFCDNHQAPKPNIFDPATWRE